MNILYINHYAGSLKMGMAFRPYYLAKEWQKAGHNVRIIGADFSHLRKTNPNVSKDFEIQNLEGAQFQWIKTRSYQGNGVKRAITMFQFCIKLFLNAKKVAKDFKPDIVIASSTYPLDTYPAQRIASISKARYIHEGHDLWPLTLTELMGMSKFNPLVVLFAIAERSAYKKSSHVVSLLPYSWKHMLNHGLQNKEKFTYIPNGISLEDWENPVAMPDEHFKVFSKLKNEGKSIVCYLGGHARSNALDVLIDAAIKTNDADVAYVLIGNGEQKPRLIEKAKNKDNIYFLPPVDKRAVPSVLEMADFLYIGAEKCSLYKYGVSMNKVYDYMMASKPIIYGIEAENNDIEDAKCGLTIDCDNPDSIINAIKGLKGMPKELLSEMGENGKKTVLNKYNYESLAKDFLKLMNN